MSRVAASDRHRESSAHTKPASGVWSAFVERLFTPVDGASVAAFRMFFGVILCADTALLLVSGKAYGMYVAPLFHFTYLGWGWVKPWPGIGMQLHLIAMCLCAACVALGLFYRAAASLLAFGTVYLFLLDKAYYQNHYYLISTMTIVMALVPMPNMFSLDAVRNPASRTTVVPTWTLWLLRFQLALPYFFGGIAKFHSDWFQGEPMRTALLRCEGLPILGALAGAEWAAYAASWAGLLFDLLVVFGLLWRRTRVIAYLAALAFHLANSQLFAIGVFPWFMIGATLIFFPPDWPRTVLRWFGRDSNPGTAAALHSPPLRTRNWIAATLLTYAVVQCVLPFQHLLYPGDSNWSEEGHHFSWRMMLRHKFGMIKFYSLGPSDQRELDPRFFLNEVQIQRMTCDPDMIVQFAHFLADGLRDMGYEQVQIRAIAPVSLNVRRAQLLVDPTIDLAAQHRTWGPEPWVKPLEIPLSDRLTDAQLRESVFGPPPDTAVQSKEP